MHIFVSTFQGFLLHYSQSWLLWFKKWLFVKLLRKPTFVSDQYCYKKFVIIHCFWTYKVGSTVNVCGFFWCICFCFTNLHVFYFHFYVDTVMLIILIIVIGANPLPCQTWFIIFVFYMFLFLFVCLFCFVCFLHTDDC